MLRPIVAAFIAGLLCQPYIAAKFAWWWIFVIAVLAGGGLIFCFMRRERRLIPYCFGVLFWAAGVTAMTAALMTAPDDISRFSGAQAACGTVSDVPKINQTADGERRIQYLLQVTKVKTAGKWQKASGECTTFIKQPQGQPIFGVGDRLEVSGKVILPHNYQNPGRVDQVMSLKARQITASLWAQSIRRDTQDHRWHFVSFLAQLKTVVQTKMNEAMAPGDAAILCGMLFGGYDGIDADVVRNFASTGIIHILSVSGTHIALVAGIIAVIGSALKVKQTTLVLLCSGSILFYSLLAGLCAPVLRSLLMALAALTALLIGREQDSAQALLLTSLGLLIYEPLWIYDLSFLLSFAATGGIIYFYRRACQYLDFLPKPLAMSAALTLVTELAVLPFLAYYFHSLPLSSLLANLFVVPILETTVVAALAGSCLVWLLPGAYLLYRFIFVGCALALGAALTLTQGLAQLLPPIYIPSLPFWGGLLYFVLLFYAFGYRSAWLPAPAVLWRRDRSKVLLAVFACLVAAGIAWWWPQPTTVHFIDVGQGDATLLITPHHHAVLIDTGGLVGEDNHFDIGERVVVPYLHHYGVTSLDYLLLTHGHQDHAGGAAAVARLVKVKQAIIAREEPSPAVLDLEREMHHEHISFATVGQSLLVDGVRIDVLHAWEGRAQSGDAKRREGNEASVVYRISCGKVSFLITGDLESDGEEQMLLQGVPQSTVLKVGHHGASNASSSDFLAAVDPKYAIISVGYHNRFGHPRPDTLARLKAQGTAIYRTDKNGAVVFTVEGDRLWVHPFTKTAGN